MTPNPPLHYRLFAVAALGLTLLLVLLPGSVIQAGVLFTLQWLPWAPDALSGGGGYLDKVVHAGLFGLCGWLLVLGWSDRARHWGWHFALLVAVGVVTEILQYFVPGRSPEALDALFNSFGAGGGVALGVWKLSRWSTESL